jgi:acyl-CoA synthetase (NDP forming)
VRALLVLSAGFAEAGPDGVRRQDELLAACRAAGMRLVGPNCLGVMGRSGMIDATYTPHAPPPGRLGLLSQSGGVGLALIEQAATLGLGLSSFVSIGNRPDVSANDVLEYWEDDSSTDVILLYLESFGNPRNFARIARRLAARKPVIAVHAGTSAAGARAAASHTGAAVAASGAGVEALLAHAGVVRAETLGELFDAGALATGQPLPAGPRVGVVTNAGGTSDPLLGPVVACGAGGTAIEVLGDVAVRLAPLTDLEARRMVRSLSTFPLLDGYRGAPRADVAALERVLLRLGALADAHPEVVELDCNPVIVAERGATVVDARVRVAPPPVRTPWPALGAEPPSVVLPDEPGGASPMLATPARN